MKIGMKRLSTITLMTLMLSSAVIALAVPGMPHQFFGLVQIDGDAAPDGVSVEARINGVTYLTETTLAGKYGYAPLFKVPADDPDTPEIEGGVNGDTVKFYVGGVLAATIEYTGGVLVDPVVFANGGSINLFLDVTTDVYELQLYAGWNLIGIPFIPDDPSIAVMLHDIIDYVESVWTYDGETGYWSSYSPGAPSDLTEMVDGKGYWIKMTNDVLWEIDI